MADAAVREYNSDFGNMGYRVTLIVSIVLHLLVLVGLPFAIKHFEKPKKYDRPKTFQLVSAPPLPPPPARKIPVEPEPVPEVKPEVKPEPKPEPKPTPVPTPEPKPTPKPETKPEPKPAPKQEQVVKKVEESTDDLASLLSNIPMPAVDVSVQGDFKYHWYLNIVRQKIMENWKPPTENRNVTVDVSFVINKDGSTANISVTKSSGHSTLDNLGIRAVTIARLPKLPPDFSGDKIGINVTLHPTRNY